MEVAGTLELEEDFLHKSSLSGALLRCCPRGIKMKNGQKEKVWSEKPRD
jgi:hypothetical protein